MLYFILNIGSIFQFIIVQVFDSGTSPVVWFLLAALLVFILVFYRTNSKLRSSREAYKENEERFRQLSNLTFEGIVIHKKGVMLDSNESFCRMFGYSFEELKHSNVVEKIVHPDDKHIVEEKVREQTTKPYEVRCITKSGNVIPVEIESRNVKLKGDSVRVAALRDITERQEQEQLIEKEQWLFTILMSNVPDSIYFKDHQSKFIRVNKNTAKKFGVENPDELIGKSDFDFFDDDHAKPAYEDEREIIQTKKPIIGKVEKETWKNGKTAWVSTTKLPLVDKENKVHGTFGITRDITALKKAEEKSRNEKEKFELLFELVPSGVFTVDSKKTITSWNKMAEKITGFSAEDVVGENCSICSMEPCEHLCGLFEDSLKKPVVNAECTLKTKNGNTITVAKNIDLIKDNNGEIIGGVESFVDISERKRYEEKIKQINNELEESNKSKDRFFSIIAHDLRNPFITLLGFTEMMIEDYEDLSDQEKIEYLREMNKTSKTSYELLDNLLQWSRAQTGRIKFEPEKINLNEILQSTFELVKKTADLKNIEISTSLKDEIWLHADSDMVTIIIRNLITNALKFTRHGGQIKVDASKEDKFCKISVIDNGIGISPERIDKILKIDSTSSTDGTEGEKGTGLGLVLTQEFVKKHGGEIWIESELDKGTTFNFTLPLSTDLHSMKNETENYG